MLLLLTISSRIWRSSSSSKRPSSDGMRALASSGHSGQRFPKAASSNLCNFFCIKRLSEERHNWSVQSQMLWPASYLPSHCGDCLLIPEFSEEIRVAECFVEHLWEFLFLFGRFVLLLTVVQQHVHFADQQGFGILEFWKRKLEL